MQLYQRHYPHSHLNRTNTFEGIPQEQGMSIAYINSQFPGKANNLKGAILAGGSTSLDGKDIMSQIGACFLLFVNEESQC